LEADRLVRELTATIIEAIGMRPDELQPDSPFDVLGIDSLANLELVMAIEERFDLKISPQDAESCRSVADLVRVILRSLRGA